MSRLTIAFLALVALDSCGRHSQSAAEFIWGLSDDGRPIFELRVPVSVWRVFAHGEPLDADHPTAGPNTRQAVQAFIQRGMETSHFCPFGWKLARYELDESGMYHFKGICLDSARTI